MKKKVIIRILLSMFVVTILISCASVKTAEKPLDVLVREYWTLRLADKYDETYKYESKKDLPEYKAYVEKAKLIKKIEIKSFEVKKIDIKDNEAIAFVEFRVLIPPMTSPLKNTLEDIWVREDGYWLHLFK